MKPISMFAAVVSILSITSACRADIVYNYNETLANFGTIDQRAPGIVNGNLACGPTSVYNSFVYLKNEWGITGLLPNNAVTTINNLGILMNPNGTNTGISNNGATTAQLIAGKTAYLNAQTLSRPIAVENLQGYNNVTALWLYDQLQRKQDVETLFSWGARGNFGHWVTVTGINYNATTGTGTLRILDPYNPVAGGGALSINATLTATPGGGLSLTYIGGAAGGAPNPDNPTAGNGGPVFSFVAESPVPEPSTFALLGLGGVGLAVTAFRRRHSQCAA